MHGYIFLVGCRTEIRLVGGIPLLIELLNTEYPEILENVITCITKCAEDCMIIF